MSHTFIHEKTKTHFIHNGDLSGDVEIGNSLGQSLEVDGRALLEFIAFWVTQCRIDDLENMKTHEVLGIKKKDMPNE